MNYRVKRDDQEFGPYSLSELQQYVNSGNISAQDMAQSEGMTEWIPVSQILGDIPIPPVLHPGSFGALEPGAVVVQHVPLPPNIPWPVMLVNYLYWVPIAGIFITIFVITWSFIQANWARKLSGKNTALVLMAMLPVGALSGGFAVGIAKVAGTDGIAAMGGVLILAGGICMVLANFKIAAAMEEYYNNVEPIGLSMSGVMIFFFGIIYIQYYVNHIARMKKSGELPY